jgi:hypothetical protein
VIREPDVFFPRSRQIKIRRVQASREEPVGDEVHETAPNGKRNLSVSRSVGKARFKVRKWDGSYLHDRNTQKANTVKDGERKPTRDLSKIKCYGYSKNGHLTNSHQCLKNIEKEKKKAQEGKDAFLNATWCQEKEGGMYATVSCEEELTDYVADAVVNMTQKVTLTQVLLDNQADISVIHPMLLEDVRLAERKIRVKGVGGVKLIVDKVGVLAFKFRAVPNYANRRGFV